MSEQCYIEQGKARPLLKDEVRLLLNLISKHRIITSKCTNAKSNRMKADAWKSVAQAFGVATGEYRPVTQLRLKWENLKKSARKRNVIIKQNNSKIGGRRRYIPPDVTLDRVASLLARTDVKVEIDDDSESDMPVSELRDVETPQPDNETLASSYIPETSNSETFTSTFTREPLNITTDQTFTHSEPEEIESQGMSIEFCAMNGNGESLQENNLQESTIIIKERTLTEDEQQSRIQKNQALAAYFQAKAEKVQLENEKLKLEIELLKNNRTPNVFNS